MRVYLPFFFVLLMQNFKREEQNFVVQNEINNLGFLTGEGKTKMSKVKIWDNPQDVGGCKITKFEVFSVFSVDSKSYKKDKN